MSNFIKNRYVPLRQWKYRLNAKELYFEGDNDNDFDRGSVKNFQFRIDFYRLFLKNFRPRHTDEGNEILGRIEFLSRGNVGKVFEYSRFQHGRAGIKSMPGWLCFVSI